MATAYVLDFPGATAADYDDLADELHIGPDLPEGLLLHGAGETPTGLRIVEAWSAESDFAAHVTARMRTATAVTGLRNPRVEQFELERILEGEGRAPAFLALVRYPDLSEAPAPRRFSRYLVLHGAGPCTDGWCVLEAWTSRDARDAHRDSTPVLARARRAEDLDLISGVAAGARYPSMSAGWTPTTEVPSSTTSTTSPFGRRTSTS